MNGLGILSNPFLSWCGLLYSGVAIVNALFVEKLGNLGLIRNKHRKNITHVII